MNRDSDFLAMSAVLLAGVAVSFAIGVRYVDTLSLYLTGRQYTLVAASLLGLVAWALLATFELDRRNALAASVLMPFVVLVFGSLLIAIIYYDAFRYLVKDPIDVFVFSGSFGAAGVGAVGLQTAADRLATTWERAPSPRVLAVAAAGLFVVAGLAGGVAAHEAASSASVTDIEPGTGTDDRPMDPRPSLHVTVDGGAVELRLEATAPDGSTTTRRVPPEAFEDGTTTVRIPFSRFEPVDPKPGTYRIELQSLPGLAVETATHTTERGPSATLVSVQTAESDDDIELGTADHRTSHNVDPEDEVTVGVVTENDGDVADDVGVRVLADDERVASGWVFLEPGQRGGYVIGLDAEAVERADGTVTVTVYTGGERIHEEVDLP